MRQLKQKFIPTLSIVITSSPDLYSFASTPHRHH